MYHQSIHNGVKIYIFYFIMIRAVCENKLPEFFSKNIQQYTINNLFNNYYEDFNITAEDNQQYNEGKTNEDMNLNITQLINKYGFPVEEHSVVTSDKYILKLFRIPGPGPVLFLMHGFGSSSDDWISPGPDYGLGFLLAAKGYDVWMGNARGNKHSKENIILKPTERKFWDFSWHEIAIYDLPVMIDFILHKTNTTSLIYIGHSQGTTVFFVLCSLFPEYNDKITLMISLSAIAWIPNAISPILKILEPINNESSFFHPLSSLLGVYDLIADGPLFKLLQKLLCGSIISASIVCENIAFFICGFNYSQANYRRLPVIYNHFPTSVSVKQFLHFEQSYKFGHFRQYDYGVDNFLKYGSIEPPSYPVEKIKAPVALFFGQGDWISVKSDVDILRSRLPNVVDFYTVPYKNFNHLDFLFAKDLKSLILPNILKLIHNYTNTNTKL